MQLSPIAQRYEQFILDLDGCVWIGDEPTPRAVEALDALRASGRDVVYATNDATVFGDAAGVSAIVNSPQFVDTTAL